ncbi:MAG: lipid-A-disaccharide synthase [Phycisphaerae bacterium]|jgi:lipid-A-disaccharide synthase
MIPFEPKRVFISVAEDSADVHGASLLRAAADRLPHCRFYGLTGPRMRDAGAETLYDFTAHAAMLAGVLSVIRHAREAVRIVRQSWQEQPPDLVVLLDSPELHLRLASRARQLGLPVLYYIAPQTWASRAYRNRRIARDVDRLACILPFEEEYFRQAGVNAEFVGHPLFEALARQQPDKAEVRRLRSGDGPLLALLPGSRRHVIDAMLPRQLDVIRQLRARGLAVRAAVSCARPERAEQIQRHIQTAGLPIEVIAGGNATLLTAADAALVASGTATFEVAHYGTPMVVMYDAGGLLAWPYRLFGRWVITSPHLALVNVLAGARVVPEFMPFVPDTRPIADTTARLLSDESWRTSMRQQLTELTAPLTKSAASARVCALIQELLETAAQG